MIINHSKGERAELAAHIILPLSLQANHFTGETNNNEHHGNARNSKVLIEFRCKSLSYRTSDSISEFTLF